MLTSRDDSKGRSAAKKLAADGADVEFRPLDVTKERSVKALADFVGSAHGRCDILVNNAGILADPRGSRFLDSKVETYRETLDTNLFGPLMLAQALVPLMRKNRYGRIVNVSSGMGQLSDMGNGSPAYRISKTALNALTAHTRRGTQGERILVNSMCPGWVQDRHGRPGAPRTVEQGADTAVWLATLPDGGPTGGFFRGPQAYTLVRRDGARRGAEQGPGALSGM